jgi:hypothetical protein
MLKVSGYNFRTAQQDGRPFYSLTLQGGIEIVRSSNGSSYITNRKCSLPTTFDEETCKGLIGSEIPGSIQKVDCPEYQYTIEATGEIITLSHRWEYLAQEQAIVRDFTKVYEPSTNGVKPMVA